MRHREHDRVHEGARESPEWPVPGVRRPPLDDAVVHVWQVSVPQFADARGGVETWHGWALMLGREEWERAARYRLAADRARFLVARSVLRTLVGRYAGLAPLEVRFGATGTGKPFLENQRPGPRLEFNLSHSHDMVLLAFARGREVGVDVEHTRVFLDSQALARRFLTPADADAVRSAGESGRDARFLRIWTRREALSKAKGTGVFAGLDGIDVSRGATDPGRLETYDSPADAGRWTLCSLDVGAAYAAAVAVEGPRLMLQRWQHE